MFKFINTQGREFEFDFSFPYFLENHKGLTGMDSNIAKQKNFMEDGITLVGHNYQERTITFYIVCQGDSDEELRILKQKAMNCLIGEGTLYYKNENETRIIDGYIKNTPEFVDIDGAYCERFQFQMLCPNPYFHDSKENRVDLGEWIGNFEFPANIPESKMALGLKDMSVMENVNVKGDAQCPIRIELYAADSIEKPYIELVGKDEKIYLETTMVLGDKIVITTEQGNKSVMLYKADGTKENIIYTISSNTTLFSLRPGDNLIKIGATTNMNYLQAFLYYNNNYGGVLCN